MPSPSDLIKQRALELGFGRVGITTAEPVPEAVESFRTWQASHFAGQMNYMAKEPNRREDPRQVLAGAKSVIVVAMNYKTESDTNPVGELGRVARYAWGKNYHKVIEKKLKRLEQFLHEMTPEPIQTKRYVDTGPLLERSYAQRAGIGFIGKNTMLISRGLGSWLFLGEILTTLELEPDEPAFGTCGRCTRCLDACPTDAFVGPYQLDARRCISYLTIEHRGPIPEELQPKMGDWIFGCDICQEVCPYNRHAPVTEEPAFQPEAGAGPTLPLDEILAIESDEEFLKRFQGTPLMRAKRQGLQRNAAVAVRNQGKVAVTFGDTHFSNPHGEMGVPKSDCHQK